MAVNNATILDQIWLKGTNDYQQRVPKATQAGVTATMKAIYADRAIYNQFVDAFVNRIGRTIVHQRRWENPLALFKIGKLEFGDSIQEVANELIKAKGYELDAQTLLQVNRPESKVFYHNVNREDKYPITINDVELKKAFLNEYGLNNYINSILEVPFTSDNYDEYQIMVNLIAEYEANTSGFFKVQVSDVVSDATGAASKTLLKLIRGYVGKLKFLSSMYNRAGVPNHTPADDLILITTPEVKASMDVDALATLFHLEKAEVQTRIVEIEEFPIAGAQALLVDKNWFVCADYVYENTSFYNPETLSTNYWLHHWGVYSASPFMNAILFTTAAASNPAVVEMTPSGFTLAATKNGSAYTEGTDTVYYGDDVKITGTLAGTVTSGYEDIVEILPDSFVYTLSAEIPAVPASGDDPAVPAVPVQLNSRTYIDKNGKLHLQNGLADGTAIYVAATCTYRDPSGRSAIASDIPYTDTLTIVVAEPQA